MHVTRATFSVHSFDSDAFGELSPAALAGYLQEAAGRSADALGCGLAELNRHGRTWFLAREQVVLDEPVRFGDALEVETWPSGIDRVAALRDFRLLRGGVEVGRAFTTWFAIDLATRRPVRPDHVLPALRQETAEHVLEPGTPAPPPLVEADVDRRFQVRFADIDANLHVTNSSYVSWALEAVDEETWREQRVAALDVQFVAECNLGSFVRSRSAVTAPGERVHAIVREDGGKELARARTRWTARR